jgi:hypothetical protein
MRLTCGSPVVGGALMHLNLLLAARGPPKTGFEPRRTGHRLPKFANFVKCSWLSAGRRACKPAAKPAIPGVILLRYALLWYPGMGGLPTR